MDEVEKPCIGGRYSAAEWPLIFSWTPIGRKIPALNNTDYPAMKP